MKDSQPSQVLMGPSQVHVGAKIPAELNARLNRLAVYFRGGKSEVVRRALAIGLASVQEAHFAAVHTDALTQQQH